MKKSKKTQRIAAIPTSHRRFSLSTVLYICLCSTRRPIKMITSIKSVTYHRFSIGSCYFNNETPYADIIPPTLVKSSFDSINAPRLVELVIQSFIHVDITQAPDRSEELECSIYVKANSQHAMCFICVAVGCFLVWGA
ncbi:hypothetical protein P8452_66359 [Trifolium repens]|nr:hypothetical protein P8452_66359 [Trifolium repens]